MNLVEYSVILRGQFLRSFGEISDAEVLEFYCAGWLVQQAVWMIGEGQCWDCSPRLPDGSSGLFTGSYRGGVVNETGGLVALHANGSRAGVDCAASVSAGAPKGRE